MPSFLNSNTNPTQISFKRTITLSTKDQNNNNNPIAESFTVSGPVSPGVTPIYIAGGTKAVIPLSTTTGDGAPYLKIHFPTSSNGNNLYITYAVANQYMADGYYDYKTGVPTAYYNALRAWINTNPSTGAIYSTISQTLRTRTLKFTAVGNSTNKPANAVTFYVKFQGLFGGVTLSNNTTQAINTTLTTL